MNAWKILLENKMFNINAMKYCENNIDIYINHDLLKSFGNSTIRKNTTALRKQTHFTNVRYLLIYS